jgi:aspartate/methionine/tyrosine aminotransferase
LREERAALGRIATQADMSISRIIQQAVIAAITKHDPATARGLTRLRTNRRRELLARTQGQLEFSL